MAASLQIHRSPGHAGSSAGRVKKSGKKQAQCTENAEEGGRAAVLFIPAFQPAGKQLLLREKVQLNVYFIHGEFNLQ
ncbi:MAG: hypothetical protein ACE5EZ_00920 [Thermodesulfobacteriota bacterium]